MKCPAKQNKNLKKKKKKDKKNTTDLLPANFFEFGLKVTIFEQHQKNTVPNHLMDHFGQPKSVG